MIINYNNKDWALMDNGGITTVATWNSFPLMLKRVWNIDVNKILDDGVYRLSFGDEGLDINSKNSNEITLLNGYLHNRKTNPWGVLYNKQTMMLKVENKFYDFTVEFSEIDFISSPWGYKWVKLNDYLMAKYNVQVCLEQFYYECDYTIKKNIDRAWVPVEDKSGYHIQRCDVVDSMTKKVKDLLTYLDSIKNKKLVTDI